jgi:glutaminyl-peptide cyclotransferase
VKNISISLLLLISVSIQAGEASSCKNVEIKVRSLSLRYAEKVIPKESRYTQGLIFLNNSIYESSGLYGQSQLNKVDVENGNSEMIHSLPKSLFAEGLASINGKLIQLTWKAEKALVYTMENDPNSIYVKKDEYQELNYEGEGWGLTHHKDQLIMSNGSSELLFLNPENMQLESKINVFAGDQPVRNLNELELVNNLIYANIYGSSEIIAINPRSGCVEMVLDVKELLDHATSGIKGKDSFWNFVANGIAYDSSNRLLYITGKNWPSIYAFKH